MYLYFSFFDVHDIDNAKILMNPSADVMKNAYKT